LLEKVSLLNSSHDELSTTVGQLKAKIQVDPPEGSTADNSRPRGATENSTEPHEDNVADQSQATPEPDLSVTNPGECSPSYRAAASEDFDLDEEYQVLSHHLNRIRPAPSEVLRDNHKGFKRDFQTTAKVISRCARYTENILKILNLVTQTEEIIDLKLIAKCQLQFLKTEYACLIVANDADNPKVAANFRRIKQGCTGMSKTDLEDYKLAVDISSQDSKSENKRNFTGNKGRGFSPKQGPSPYKSFMKARDNQPPRPGSQASE
jgi:hypothetical protein